MTILLNFEMPAPNKKAPLFFKRKTNEELEALTVGDRSDGRMDI